MKLGFSQQEIKGTLAELNLPEHSYYMRRAARALDIVNQDKVHFLGEDVYRVDSQFDDKHYHTELNHGNPGCTCEDFKKNGVACKHMIAATIYKKERQAKQAITQIRIRKRPDGVFCWIDGNTVGNADYNQKTGHWYCGCMRLKLKESCKHIQEIRRRFGDDGNGGNGSKITNECGSNEALELQNKLNGQLNKSGNNGNGDAKSPSQPMQLDISDPYQQAEQLDIDQIEGRRNGELAWKLSNGEYVISYRGIMTLAEKHNIDFPTIIKSQQAVIAYSQKQDSLRLSGKPVRTYDTPIETVCELAKRNAARQLLPLPEIKAIEHKTKLTAEFDWQKAKAKCSELVGEANVNIIIRDLVSAGKLRQDNPSHYDRTEWLIIYDACEKDAEVERDPESLNRWSYNSAEFLDRCREAINKVRDDKAVEVNELPLEGNNHKRKIQMDKKLRTWLIETDLTSKPISCREICETFESEKNPRIVTRLRAGIDSGADISTVELDD
jgi:hypothetical protein